MPVTVHAKAPDLKKLTRDLKEAGRSDLRKELYAGLNRGTKPLRGDIKATALDRLPSEGGLNVRVAAANIRVTGSGGRVRIVARPSKRGGQFDPAQTNAGAVSHPTYGHRPTITQSIPPGWFNDPILRGLPQVQGELLEGIENVAAKLAAG